MASVGAGDKVIVTGASGTVGRALLPRLHASGLSIASIGRRQSAELKLCDDFVEADLGDIHQLHDACAVLQRRVRPNRRTGRVRGLVLAAGVDSRHGARDLTYVEWDRCMRINAYAGLKILAEVAPMSTVGRTFPVVVWSSDVVTASHEATCVYASSKAALEEGVRHAASDLRVPGIAVLLIRLPNIGVPMAMAGNSARVNAAPRPALYRAVEAAADFLMTGHLAGTVEVWADA